MQAHGGEFLAGAAFADEQDGALDTRRAGEAFLKRQKGIRCA
jgi:hypothetical protein